jgi:hypothetical protein
VAKAESWVANVLCQGMIQRSLVDWRSAPLIEQNEVHWKKPPPSTYLQVPRAMAHRAP